MPRVDAVERKEYETLYRQRPGYKERRREYHAKTYEARQEWHKQYYARNKEKILARTFKQHLKATYGIDFLTYSALLIVQAGRCSSCKTPMQDPHVDHDHVDGKVRGLLCRDCNTAIGFANDSIPQLVQCIDYLKRFQ